MQVQTRKLEVVLEQQGPQGTGPVDYEKLRIENQQQADKLRRRMAELPQLRASTGRATQVLLHSASALQCLLKASSSILIE